MSPKIIMNRERLADFCKTNHIRRLAVFGSMLRDDFNADSDVDMLVEFEEGFTPGFAFFRMEEDLSRLIGRRVDLNTPKFLSHYIRDRIANEAEVLYAQT